ncbi:MAG: CBS domain-containing protein, partial [Prochlorothrix sp.]|nr:CBS domain-containing protein [Prochlorothrix sp.]
MLRGVMYISNLSTKTTQNLIAAIIRDPITTSADVAAKDAIALMSNARSSCSLASDLATITANPIQADARASCVLVLDAQQVVGILTERDVVRLSAQGQTLENLRVSDVMSSPVLTLQESALTDIFAVISTIQQHQVRHLPIVDRQNDLVGLVTYETLRQGIQPVDLLRLRLAQEIMQTRVVVAPPSASLLAIAQRMAQNRVSSVVIVEPGAGIKSIADLEPIADVDPIA